MISRWNGNGDSCTLEWLAELARMDSEDDRLITLTDEKGQAFVRVDVMTAQDIVEDQAA